MTEHCFAVGGFYEDCAYHPCLCVVLDEDARDIEGVSLIDGSAPRSCSLDHCGPEPLTLEQAIAIRADLESHIARREAGMTIEQSVGNPSTIPNDGAWPFRPRPADQHDQ